MKKLKSLIEEFPHKYEEVVAEGGVIYLYLTPEYINEATDTHCIEGNTITEVTNQLHHVKSNRK